MTTKELISNYLDDNLKKLLLQIDETQIQEIRLRIDKPLVVKISGTSYFVGNNESIINVNLTDSAVIVGKSEFDKILEKIARFSMYAFQDEIKNGYITINGGHRVGLTGKAVIENGQIKTIKDINSMNIRISHEIVGCGEQIIKLFEDKIFHTLIISPPGCGKTTLLRDLVRLISDRLGKTIGVVDERSEIAGQNYVGAKTDVLDGCPKSIGMIMLLRSMCPEVIAVDEIGKVEDVDAIEQLIYCGVSIIATIHGTSINDIERKPNVKKLLSNKIFQRYIVMDNPPGTIKSVYDENFTEIWRW